MMKDKATRDILDSKMDKLSELAGRISDDFDKDDIHDFRTTTKSLRSLLRLLRTNVHKRDIKLTKDFKRLYGNAGALREAQLEKTALAEMHLRLPAYMHGLEKKIKTQQTLWAAYYHNGIIKALAANLADHDYGAMNATVLKDFFKEKLDTLAVLTDNAAPTQAEIHQARKDAKDIVYTSRIAKKHWKEVEDTLSKMDLDGLDQLCDTIGNYLDGCVLLNHMDAFSTMHAGNNEAGTIRDFCDEKASRLMEEKTAVLSAIAAFVRDNRF